MLELLVCCSIISVLVAMLLPALNSARDQSYRVKDASNLHQIGLALETYAHDHDGFFLDAPLSVTGNQASCSYSYNTDGSGGGNLWLTQRGKATPWHAISNYILDTSILYCPAAVKKNFHHSLATAYSGPVQPWTNLTSTYFSYAIVYMMNDSMDPSVLAFDTPLYTWVKSGYAYQGASGEAIYIKTPTGYVYDDTPSHNYLYGSWATWGVADTAHGTAGNNVLFTDGRVEWQPGKFIGPLRSPNRWPPGYKPAPTFTWIRWEY